MTSGMSSRALAVPVRGMTATTGSTSRTPMAGRERQNLLQSQRDSVEVVGVRGA